MYQKYAYTFVVIIVSWLMKVKVKQYNSPTDIFTNLTIINEIRITQYGEMAIAIFIWLPHSVHLNYGKCI